MPAAEDLELVHFLSVSARRQPATFPLMLTGLFYSTAFLKVLNNMRLTLLEIEETLQHQQLQTNSREQLLHVMSRLRGLLVKAKDNVVVSGRRLPEECMGQVS